MFGNGYRLGKGDGYGKGDTVLGTEMYLGVGDDLNSGIHVCNVIIAHNNLSRSSKLIMHKTRCPR